ncbi:putative SMC N superfamily protein [Candidatus Termititenax aidoneus]|uniref:SMC N superfamily protein n=1 Tax=Termititenax aidoneus TaxID=2218524 RepID=A0A388TAM3_TERA1|nr:putative SMC N superfamily protein [Candidatus Termititenax aidoneus]
MSEIKNLLNIAQAASYALTHSTNESVSPEIIELAELQYIRRIAAQQYDTAMAGVDRDRLNAVTPDSRDKLYAFKDMIEHLPSSFIPAGFDPFHPQNNETIEPPFLRAALMNIFDEYFSICSLLEQYEDQQRKTTSSYTRPPVTSSIYNTMNNNTLGQTELNKYPGEPRARISDRYEKELGEKRHELNTQLDLLDLIQNTLPQVSLTELPKADLETCFRLLKNISDNDFIGLLNLIFGYHHNSLDFFMGKADSGAVPEDLNIKTLTEALIRTAGETQIKIDSKTKTIDTAPETRSRQINNSRTVLQDKLDAVALLFLDAARLNQAEHLYNWFLDDKRITHPIYLEYFAETSPLALLKDLSSQELKAGDEAAAKGDMLGAYIHYQNAEAWAAPDTVIKYLDIKYIEEHLGVLNDKDREIWISAIAELRGKINTAARPYRESASAKIDELRSKINQIETALTAENISAAARLGIISQNSQPDQNYMELYYQLKKSAEVLWRDDVIAVMSSPQDALDIVNNPEFRNQAQRHLAVLPAAFAVKTRLLFRDAQVRTNNQEIMHELYYKLAKEYDRAGNKNRWWPKTTDAKDPAWILPAFLRDQIGGKKASEAPRVRETPEIVSQAVSSSKPVVIPRGGETSSTFKNISITDPRETSGDDIYKVTDPDGYAIAEGIHADAITTRDTAEDTLTAKETARDTAADAQDTAQEAKNAAQDAVDDATDQVKDCGGEIAGIQGEINGAQKGVEAAQKVVDRIGGLVDETQEAVNLAQTDYDTAVSDYTAKESAYNQAAQAVSDAETAVSTAEGNLSQAEAERDTAYDNYNDDPTPENLAAYQAAEQALTDAQGDLTAAQTAEYNANISLGAAESAKDFAEALRDSTSGALDDKRNQLSDLQNELSSVLGELNAAQGELTAANGQLSIAQENLAAAQEALTAAEADLNTSASELAAKKQALEAAQAEVDAADQALKDAQTTLNNTPKPDLKDYSSVISTLAGEKLDSLIFFDNQGNPVEFTKILTGSIVTDAAGNFIGFYCSEKDPVTGEKIGKLWYIAEDGTLKEADVELSTDANGNITIKAKGDAITLWPGGPKIGYIGDTNIFGSMLKVESIDRDAGVLHLANVTGVVLAKEVETVGADGKKTKTIVPIEAGEPGAELQELLELVQTGVDPDTGDVRVDVNLPEEVVDAIIKNGYVLYLTSDTGDKALGLVDIVGAENITPPAEKYQAEYSTTTPKALLFSRYHSVATAWHSDPEKATGSVRWKGQIMEYGPETRFPANVTVNPKTGTIIMAGDTTIEDIYYDENLGQVAQIRALNGEEDPQIVKEVDRALGGALDIQHKVISPSTMTRDFFDAQHSIFESYQDGQNTGFFLNGEYLRFDDPLVQEAMREIKEFNAELGTGYEDFPTLLALVYLKRKYKKGRPVEPKQSAKLLEDLQGKYNLNLSAEELENLQKKYNFGNLSAAELENLQRKYNLNLSAEELENLQKEYNFGNLSAAELENLQKKYNFGNLSAEKLENLQNEYHSLSTEKADKLFWYNLALLAAPQISLDSQKIAVFSSAKNGLSLTFNSGITYTSLGVEDYGQLTSSAGLNLDWQGRFGLFNISGKYHLDNITGAPDYAWADKSMSRFEYGAKYFLPLAENIQPYLSYFGETMLPHDLDEWSTSYHLLGAGLRGNLFLGRLNNSATGRHTAELNFDVLLFDQLLTLEDNGNLYNNVGVTGNIDLKLGSFGLGLDGTLFWRNHWFLAEESIFRQIPNALVSPKFYPHITYDAGNGLVSFGAEIGSDFARGSFEQKLSLSFTPSNRFTFGLHGNMSEYVYGPWFAPTDDDFQTRLGGGGGLFAEWDNKYKINAGVDVQQSGNPEQAPKVDFNLGFSIKNIDLLKPFKPKKK